VLAAVEHVNVTLGIDRDTSGFNKVFACRQLEEIRHWFVGKFGYCRRQILRRRHAPNQRH
jgi:hypothetical protein